MNKKTIIGLVIGILCIGIIVLSASASNTQKQVKAPTEKMQVVASFYPLYFFSSQIGGDKAEVLNITPSGAEPHDYEPTPKDLAAIQNSNLLILNGAGLEPWAENVLKGIPTEKVVIAGDRLATLKGEKNEHKDESPHEDVRDPHVWLSPLHASQMVDTITIGFVKADPENNGDYQNNANILKAKLAELDTDYKSGLASCTQKNIITSHAAFGYIAKAYNFNQVAIAGLSPEAEPSPKEIATVAEFAKKNTVKYIFFESLVSPKLSQTIANEVGAKTLVLNPIEGLTPEEIADGKTYLTEMKNNLTNLRIALECK